MVGLLVCAIIVALSVMLTHREPPRLAIAAKPPRQPAKLPLSGVLIVLDPGHGGADSGASKDLLLPEAALTYRTALEMAHSLRAQGAEVVYTVQSRALSPTLFQTEPPPLWPQDAVLAGSGRPLTMRHRRSPVQLWARAAVAKQAWKRRAKTPGAQEKMAFLSLHFDFSQYPQRQGGHVYVDSRSRPAPRLAQILERRMAQAGLLGNAEGQSITLVSARELGVLNPQFNPVQERVLIEIATLSNWNDALDADDSQWRWRFCQIVTAALVERFKERT